MRHTAGEILILWLKMFLAWLEAIYRLFVPVTPKSVKGRIILVTGGSKGIGRQIALKFSKIGAKLVLWDIDKEGLEGTANEITSRGGFVKSYICDVSKYDDVRRVAEQVRQEVGDVNLLVNNAGILHADEILNLEEKQIRKTIDINILAHFWTVKEFLPQMYESNDGHIVSIASSAGLFGTGLLTDYCASKFAVMGFTEALSEEMRRYKKTGIYTTTVCPLFVNTNMLNQGSKITCDTGFDSVMEADYVSLFYSFDSVMEADYVADHIVQGILKNQRFVFLPAIIGILYRLHRLMPWKIHTLLKDFLKSGFYKNHDY